MKKLLSFFICSIILILVFVPNSTFSQANVISQVNQDLAISVGRGSFILSPGATVRTNLLPANGEQEITITWTQGIKDHRVVKKVNIQNGRLLITDQLLTEPTSSTSSTQSQNERSTATAVFTSPQSKVGGYTTNLVIENKSNHRFLIRMGNFTGLALKPGQTSDSLMISLGLAEFVLLVDLDQDTLSTGRNYMQQVVTGIVVKDQKSFLITDRHIHIPFIGERARFVFVNNTKYEVVGVGSKALGRVIGPNRSIRERINANEGFVNTAWQYIDDTGNKRMAMSEFVVYQGKVRVLIEESDLLINYRAQ